MKPRYKLEGLITCKKCGHLMDYLGEHWDDEEGWASFYQCRKCTKDRSEMNRLKVRWREHLKRCSKQYCDRCNGKGFKKKGLPDPYASPSASSDSGSSPSEADPCENCNQDYDDNDCQQCPIYQQNYHESHEEI